MLVRDLIAKLIQCNLDDEIEVSDTDSDAVYLFDIEKDADEDEFITLWIEKQE